MINKHDKYRIQMVFKITKQIKEDHIIMILVTDMKIVGLLNQ
jgi:hypothetical protein